MVAENEYDKQRNAAKNKKRTDYFTLKIGRSFRAGLLPFWAFPHNFPKTSIPGNAAREPNSSSIRRS